MAKADCHRKIKDYDSAVKCYQDIIGQEIDLESDTGEIHVNTLTSLFAIWSEVADHAGTLSFLRELKGSSIKWQPNTCQ